MFRSSLVSRVSPTSRLAHRHRIPPSRATGKQADELAKLKEDMETLAKSLEEAYRIFDDYGIPIPGRTTQGQLLLLTVALLLVHSSLSLLRSLVGPRATQHT